MISEEASAILKAHLRRDSQPHTPPSMVTLARYSQEYASGWPIVGPQWHVLAQMNARTERPWP